MLPEEKAASSNVLAPVIIAGALLVPLYFLSPFFYYKNAAPLEPLTLQTFTGDAKVSLKNSAWSPPQRGSPLPVKEWAQTGKNGGIDFTFGTSAHLRLKENSLIQILPPPFFSQAKIRVHLLRGRLLVWNKNDRLMITANPVNKVRPRNILDDFFTRFVESSGLGIFTVAAFPDRGIIRIALVRGDILVTPFLPVKSLSLKNMKMMEAKGFVHSKPLAMTQEEWKVAHEAYEIAPKSAAVEALQIDLSKKAGNFFVFVFDHGTFYQRRWGWCDREFIAPEKGGDPLYLEATYDVFPTGSWVGIYFKIRDLDFFRYKSFRLEARRVPEGPAPQSIKIEFKSKGQVLRAFAIKHIPAPWDSLEFPLRARESAWIDEVTLIFSHDRVGTNKSGGVQLRNFVLVPAPEKPAAGVRA